MVASSAATNVCCFNIDGMDQSKFRIPRVKERATTKLFQRLFRPVLHICGSWCHGHKLFVFVADDDLRKDSTTQQEVLARCLSDIYDTYSTLPMGLHIQQDNTYREGKNRYFISHCILLCALRVFRYAVLSYLRPGHRAFAASNYCSIKWTDTAEFICRSQSRSLSLMFCNG